MGQHNLIIRKLEDIVELVNPFLPKVFGGQGKSLFSDIPEVLEIRDAIMTHNPLTRWIGDNPIIFLDTGAIIDFEKYFHDNSYGKREDKGITRDCHGYLGTLAQTGRVIITDYMGKELENHRNCYIGRRKEISDQTFSCIDKINEHSNKVIKRLKPRKDREQIRLEIYFAAKECFKDDDKKGYLDPISDNDKNLVVDAIYTRNSKIDGKDVTASIIFSPDRHILGLTHFLKNPEYDYQGIFAFPSRSGKDGRYDIH